jgi:hypothetical protein
MNRIANMSGVTIYAGFFGDNNCDLDVTSDRPFSTRTAPSDLNEDSDNVFTATGYLAPDMSLAIIIYGMEEAPPMTPNDDVSIVCVSV